MGSSKIVMLMLTVCFLAACMGVHYDRPAEAANTQGPTVGGTPVAGGYHFDDQDGAFLADVASVATTGTSLTVSDTQASGRRTFYPAGRQSLSLWTEWTGSGAQTCTVTLEYFGKHPTTGARVFQGRKSYDFTNPGDHQTETATYDAERRLVDAGAARSIDVKVTTLVGTVKGVHVGSQ